MANFVYSHALGLLNSTVLTGDLRAALVMTNTTADTDEDAEFMDDFGTLDEYDGSAYARVALTSEAFAVDTANDRFKFSNGSVTFSTLGAGTREAQAMIIYLHVADDTDSKPLFYIEPGGFPVAGNGNDLVLTPHADGTAYLRNAD